MIANVVVIAIVLIFAIGGYARGFIVSIASFIGFFAGLIIGIRLATLFANRIAQPGPRIGLVLVVVIGCGIIGQVAFGKLAAVVKRRMTWNPAQVLDRVLGALVSGVAALLVCWMLAVPLASSSLPNLSASIKASGVIRGVNDVMPSGMRVAYEQLQTVLAEQGLPDVLGPLSTTDAPNVPTPTAGLAATPAIQATRASIVKVHGDAPQCSRVIDGSGFVIAHDRILTNAHVVAGTSKLTVESVSGNYDAVPVYVDEKVDIAVLQVTGLHAPALAIAEGTAPAGGNAVVAGFPGGGPYRAESARIRTSGDVSGPDFRNDATVVRDVYSLRAQVIPGNSGGPLLSPAGKVLGVVFASAADNSDVGYALTDHEIAGALNSTSTTEVGTGKCD